MHKVPAVNSRKDIQQRSEASGEQSTALLPHPKLQVAGFVTTLLIFLLIADSFFRVPGAFDYRLIGTVQEFVSTYAGTVFGFVSGLSSLTYLAVAWVGVLVAAAFIRAWGTVVATGLAPIVGVPAVVIHHFVTTGHAIDPSVLEQAVPQAGFAGQPGGEIIGAALIYGLAILLARRIQFTALRVAVQIASVAIIAFASVNQLVLGAMWPADVLAAYAIAGLVLIPLLWLAQRVDSVLGHIPAVRAANVNLDESKPQMQALTSTVVFNEATVSKIYRPGFLPRAIYWAAFQAEFPYMRNQPALRAAVQRRNLIGLLTEYWYGENRVARAIGIDEISGRYAITSEYVAGTPPRDREAAREFLDGLVKRFETAGLPTWQIDPVQPRAIDNVIEAEGGTFHVVDLESGLVAPLASIRTWKRALKRGMFPLYDDVFFDVTRSYIEKHEASMRAELGEQWVQRLHATLAATEATTQAWHDSEPRLWSRLLGRSRSYDNDTMEHQQWVFQWFEGAFATWHDEDRISGAEAQRLRQTVRSSQFASIIPHFAVHLGISVVLRFPLGSIARSGYTIAHLLRASWQWASGRSDRETWRDQASVHSPLVALLAAIPGIGSFAYLVAKPVRSEHLLLRIALDAVLLTLPWRLYERIGLRRLVTDISSESNDSPSEATSKGQAQYFASTVMFTWSEEHRQEARSKQNLWSIEATEGVGVRLVA